MTLIKAQEKIKNALMIGSDVCPIKPKLFEDEINSMNNNVIGQGKGTRDEIKQLVTQCVKVYECICMSVCEEFRDGFFPYAAMNYNKGILLHTLSLQQNDSRIDSSLCTCLAGLGHKSKLSVIEEITCVNSLNDMECPSKAKNTIQRRSENILNQFLCAVT